MGPWLVSTLGPRVGEVALGLYMALDAALQRLTQRLLKRDMWRWVFYAHLLVLYTIAASCYVQAGALDASNPVDAISVHMTEVATDAGVKAVGIKGAAALESIATAASN